MIFSGAPDVSGTWNNDNSDPLWIARFNAADNRTELRINIGDDPNSSDALVIGTTTGGGADFNQTGTWTPLHEFYAWGGLRLRFWNDPSRYVDWWRHENGFSFQMVGANFHNTGTRRVTYDGDSNWDFTSDGRLKKDIVDAEPMLDRVLRLPVRRYRWKEEDASA